MFFSYFISGFIPLMPYLFAVPSLAFWMSILLSLLALFIPGLRLMSAKTLKTKVWKSSIRMLVIGGVAIGVGVINHRPLVQIAELK